MRKFLVLLCSLFVGIIFICGGVSSAYATSNTYVTQDITLTANEVKQTLVNFVYGEDATTYDDNGARVNRTAGSEQELAAANYLLTQLKTILQVPDYAEGEQIDPTKNEAILQSFKFENALSKTFNSQNVVALLKKPSATINTKTVIIGAHYDNYYNYSADMFSSNAIKSHGIYDNAGGVTALLEIAKVMVNNMSNVDYNIMFVLYGAEEMGMCGSRYFYSSLTQEIKQNILLTINLDAIGVGDKMYMYADEVETLHQNYFKDIADELFFNNKENTYFNLPPKVKKVAYGTGNLGISYTHMGLASDNYVLVANGINTITFFSGAWETTNKLGIAESSTNKNISHTSNDNLNVVEQLYGKVFYNRIASTVNLVCNALVQDSFNEVMMQSAEQKSDYHFFVNDMYIKVILIAIIVVVWLTITLITRKKLKQLPTPTDPEIERLRKAILDNDMSSVGGEITVSGAATPTSIPQEQVDVYEVDSDVKEDNSSNKETKQKTSTKTDKEDE